MGVLIKIDGANFDKDHIIGKVDIIPECQHEYDNACDTDCNLCGFTREVTHDYDENGYCTVCGQRDPNKPYTLAEYPVTDGLKGLYDFGSATENGSLYNHADPSLVPTLVELTADGGKWTEEANYATFSGGTNKCRVDTNIKSVLGNKVAWVALFSVPTGFRPIVGCRRVMGSATTAKYGVDLYNDRVEYIADGKWYEEVYDNGINSDNFAILALTADTNGWKVYRYTNGALVLWDEYVGVLDPWTVNEPICIGGDRLSNSRGDAHISLAAIHEGVMTDEQLESICQFVKDYGEQKGLTIE